MHPRRKQRLLIVLAIVVVSTTAIGLMFYAARESINLFYPPSKIVSGEAPVDRTLKAGGCVVPGSIVRSTTDLKIRFDITDGMATVPVQYEGILPDLFEEGEAAVIDGKLHANGILVATRVLAKHDENYTPSEVSDSLNENEDGLEHQKTCEGLAYGS
jgi:cytochrome c-type biogenesis protein CcmE